MHMVNLGLWKDLLECVFCDMKKTLQEPTISTGNASKSKNIFSDKAFSDLLGDVKNALETMMPAHVVSQLSQKSETLQLI